MEVTFGELAPNDAHWQSETFQEHLLKKKNHTHTQKNSIKKIIKVTGDEREKSEKEIHHLACKVVSLLCSVAGTLLSRRGKEVGTQHSNNCDLLQYL